MKNFAILGLRPGASAAEIKRAYRKLAMRWHPDRNSHPRASERFAQIRSAYERLLTTSERAATRVDAADPAGRPPSDAAEAAEPAETGPSAAGAGTGAAPESGAESRADSRPRAGDVRQTLVLSLEEAAQGCSKTLSLLRGKACRQCAGSGEGGVSKTHFCQRCHGSGRIKGEAVGQLSLCPACDGRGVFSERRCPTCQGSGRELQAVSLEVVVPPAMLAGDELRLPGQGEPGSDFLAPGDLFLTLVIRAHALYRRQGRDLHCVMPVSALALMTGDDIEIPLLAGGRLRHRLEPGLPEGRELRFPGRGYPGRDRHLPGQLFVRLQPVFPRRLDPRQRALLQEADAALRDDPHALPEITAWKKAHASE